MRENDKVKKILYINHSGELLIWLLVILFIVFFYFIFNINKEKTITHYKIFMPDVDGLIVGSPVRMMGIEVGHVTKIKPVGDDVYVKFILTDKTVTVPQGTIATVEFSGMAGSKSLELYLPDENSYIDDKTAVLTVSPPKRLHDAMGLLDDMFNRIGAMITTASIFGDNLKKIELPQNGEDSDISKLVDLSNGIIDKTNNITDDLRSRLKNGRKN